MEATDYEGWKAEQLSNQWVTLILVPKLGGRLMQVTFAGHSYLFVNPRYKGKYFPPSSNLPQGRWYNYGGDKLWPLPEGTEDDHHWPGPRADLLDDGEFSLQVLSQAPRCAVRLTGPADPWTGLQYTRDINIGSDSPEIWFHAVMKNATGHPIEWSMESVSQYDTADPKSPGQYNHDFWAFTPANPHSGYPDGYRVESGLADPRSFGLRDGPIFSLHWTYLENELWVDSPGDWLAVVNHSSGYAMVEQFHIREGANYPGKASVIFYVNGPSLELDEHGMPRMTSAKPEDTPYYMEAEIISPPVRLAPGETYAMDTHWFPARVASTFRSVTDAALVSEPLTAQLDANGVHLSGTFGVFFPGRLVAHIYDADGAETDVISMQDVNPAQLVSLNQNIRAPRASWRTSVHLEDQHGVDRGSLGEARLTKSM